MHEHTCPHCHKAFTIDEAGYADLVKQVRDDEFAKALHERLALAGAKLTSGFNDTTAKLASEHMDAQAKQAAKIKRAAATSNLTELCIR